MQLNWQSDVEPSTDREVQPLMRADLPRGESAMIGALNDGRILARICDAVTGQECARAVFTSEDEAKAWVEDQAQHVAAAASGVVVAEEEQRPMPDARLAVDVDEASEESFPASDSPSSMSAELPQDPVRGSEEAANQDQQP